MKENIEIIKAGIRQGLDGEVVTLMDINYLKELISWSNDIGGFEILLSKAQEELNAE